MIKSEKINFLAKKIAPNPWECTYWIDLSADREGKIWKVWNGLDWVVIFTGTGGGAIDAYTKQESDLKYATKLEMQSVADSVTDKQDTLVSGTNIKTINSQSILGSGDIKIDIPDTSSFVTDSEVDDKIAELVGSAPAALDTLNELAAALNNDANFATTITNQLSNKVDTSTYTSDKSTFALKSELPTNISQLTNDSGYLTSIPDEYVTDTELTQKNYATTSELETQLNSKQDTLVSGTNIKTVNGQSILGTGNIQVETPEGGIADAPQDGSTYGRKDGAWSEIVIPDISGLATKTELSNKLDTETYNADKATFVTTTQLASKQDTLVSGTNIKTVNGQTILGEGNIQIETPEGGIADAPSDNNTYARKNGAWSAITIPDTTSFATKEELANKANTSDLSNYLTTANAEDTYATKSALESKLDTSTYTSDKSTFATKTELQSKQDILVSGTSIKTINGNSLLGSGDITIESSTSGITDAPSDDKLYARKNAEWSEVVIPAQGSAMDITSAVWDTDHYKSVIAFNDSWDIIKAIRDNKVTNFTVSRGEIDSLRNLTKVINFSVANMYMENKYVHIILFGSDGETDTKLDIRQLTDDPLDSNGKITVTETKVGTATPVDITSILVESSGTGFKSNLSSEEVQTLYDYIVNDHVTQFRVIQNAGSIVQQTLFNVTDIQTTDTSNPRMQLTLTCSSLGADLAFTISANGTSGSFTNGTSTVDSVFFSDFLTSSSLKTINNQSLVGSGNISIQGNAGEARDITNLIADSTLSVKETLTEEEFNTLLNYITEDHITNFIIASNNYQSGYSVAMSYCLSNLIPVEEMYLITLTTSTTSYNQELQISGGTVDGTFQSSITTNEVSFYNIFATKESLNTKVTGSGVTTMSVVTALPGSPDENTLYIITES